MDSLTHFYHKNDFYIQYSRPNSSEVTAFDIFYKFMVDTSFKKNLGLKGSQLDAFFP